MVAPGPVVSQAAAELGQDGYGSSLTASYVLRPSDVIKVDVFREADLSLESVAVSATGEVSLPLIGQITVAGLSAGEVEDRIEEMLATRYLRNPRVSVNVLNYNSHQVTVEGRVESPGLYDFRPGTRLSGAIALAQGLSRVAEPDEIAIFRQADDGIEVAKFDYTAVRSGTMLDPVLHPGDRVVVGTDGLSQLWQDLLRALPLFALFTRI
ncbi:polysaccharide biosynthesis/export family protein [Aurantiacibacter marinus]|uniref:polysaccharide biosynthesis/export family protein n=1 Tax=Aurantiacibacter marinus TaxID=874156 RepID=UPI001E433963|nr:polysaccharide biosynthesis/export family protein [Aurantiacibacter marinus]